MRGGEDGREVGSDWSHSRYGMTQCASLCVEALEVIASFSYLARV